jgi:hypothetical protein
VTDRLAPFFNLAPNLGYELLRRACNRTWRHGSARLKAVVTRVPTIDAFVSGQRRVNPEVTCSSSQARSRRDFS